MSDCSPSTVYRLQFTAARYRLPSRSEHVAAESDELLRREIGRELFGQLQRMMLPVAHDILILVAGARNVAALAIEIAQPEVPERE